MAVKIRLTRMGKKKQPTYRVVVVDSRRPRDSSYIEQIGRYDPRQDPSLVEIDNDKALAWLANGAQATERARKLLEISGAWSRFRVAKGDVHTIDDTPRVEKAAPHPEHLVDVPDVADPQDEVVHQDAAVTDGEAARAAPTTGAEEP